MIHTDATRFDAERTTRATARQALAACLVGVIASASPSASAQGASGCAADAEKLSNQAMEAYVMVDMIAVETIDKALSMAADPNCAAPASLIAKMHIDKGIIVFYLANDAEGARKEFDAALGYDPGAQPDPQFLSEAMTDIWGHWKAAKDKATATAPAALPSSQGDTPPGPAATGYGYGNSMLSMTIHVPVTEQIRKTPIPISIQVNPALMPSVEGVFLYYQLPGETLWNPKTMVAAAGGIFTTKIDCNDGIFIFDPDWVRYYIVVTGAGGIVLLNEPAAQAAGPHVVKMVQVLAGEPPAIPGQGPEETCREITCFSTPECEAELGKGATCFEGICSVPEAIKPVEGDKSKGKGTGGAKSLPGLLLITAGVTPAASFGLVSGKAYDKDISDQEGPDITTGFAWGGAAVRASIGWFLPMGLGFTGYFRMQLKRGDNGDWDGAFDLFSAGVRLNYMAVRKKLVLLDVFLGAGYGKYRHRIENVANPCYLRNDYPSYFAEVPGYCELESDGSEPPKHVDFWRQAGLFDISAGTMLLIRPTDVFGIPIEVSIDVLLPTFAMNVDVSIGVAFFFGTGFKDKEKETLYPETF